MQSWINVNQLKQALAHTRVGDWVLFLLALFVVALLLQTYLDQPKASRVEIQVDGKLHGTYSLDQAKDIHLHSVDGSAVIQIAKGKARFKHASCHRQYCVHQGWLKREGQVAMCLPNRMLLTLVGDQPPYDSLNY